MKTIPQLLDQRQAERRADASRVRFARALHLAIIFVTLSALAGVMLHLVSGAIERAAFDAVNFQPARW